MTPLVAAAVAATRRGGRYASVKFERDRFFTRKKHRGTLGYGRYATEDTAAPDLTENR